MVQTPAFVVPFGFGYVAKVRSICVLSSIRTITRFGHSDTGAIVWCDHVVPLNSRSWINGWGADVNDVLTAAKTRSPEESSHFKFIWSSALRCPETAATGVLHPVFGAPLALSAR